jgi:hypothetical protein
MPLRKGKKFIGRNIKEMMAAGHPHDQSVAAAMNAAGMSKKKKRLRARKKRRR